MAVGRYVGVGTFHRRVEGRHKRLFGRRAMSKATGGLVVLTVESSSFAMATRHHFVAFDAALLAL